MQLIRTLATVILCILFIGVSVHAQHKYIGTKMCSMCHKTEKQGNQLGIWQKSKHAEAYKSLTTAKANEVAKSKGLTKPAAESPECLECHTLAKTVDAKLLDKTFVMKEGVQCEACHGPGSDYKSITIMKDKKKAVEAGMHEFKDAAAIEKQCKTCHNEKSPFYKEFKFEQMWNQIKHPVPKAG